MLHESLYRLYASSSIFHPTCKFIYSFIRCQIKDGDGHFFATDNVDSDDEKSRQVKKREWIKWRHQLGLSRI